MRAVPLYVPGPFLSLGLNIMFISLIVLKHVLLIMVGWWPVALMSLRPLHSSFSYSITSSTHFALTLRLIPRAGYILQGWNVLIFNSTRPLQEKPKESKFFPFQATSSSPYLFRATIWLLTYL